MKTKRLEKKLTLNKETVSHLDMTKVRGGDWTYNSCHYTCPYCDTVETCMDCIDIDTMEETCEPGWC
jgi:hypothetical protein